MAIRVHYQRSETIHRPACGSPPLLAKPRGKVNPITTDPAEVTCGSCHRSVYFIKAQQAAS